MIPRERVVLALKHEEPDRIPIDLGATTTTSINVFAYKDLAKKLISSYDRPFRIYDLEQMIVDVDKEILDYFNVDIININRSLEPCAPYPYLWRYGTIEVEVSSTDWKKYKLYDGTLVEIPKDVEVVEQADGYLAVIRGTPMYKMPSKGYYFWALDRYGLNPLENVKTIDDVKKFDWDSFKVSDRYIEILRKKAEYLYTNTNYALFFGWAAVYHETIQSLRGWARWLSDLRIRKSLAEAILDNLFEPLKYNVEKFVNALKDYVQVIGFGDDFGTEEGPQISVEIFREFYKHRFEELFSIVKRRSKMFIYFHSCGSIYPIIKELIDAGIDAINPVQISAKGMDPEKLKRDYGEQVTFWGGGADTQHVLPFAKPEEVVEHVKKLIKIFAPGGGFVFASVHNIQPPTPPENIIAMFETAYKYGKYPIRAS